MNIVGNRFSRLARAALCLQRAEQAALGRGWAATGRPSAQKLEGWLTGQLESFIFIIIVASPTVKLRNA
jgi:hypothetical protein